MGMNPVTWAEAGATDDSAHSVNHACVHYADIATISTSSEKALIIPTCWYICIVKFRS
jgi:hypothetical protein